jgi:ATP-binding cassette subfamily F protein uup
VLDIVKDVAEYIKIGKGKRLSASQLLDQFMFPPRQQHQKASLLSGGEQRRLSLLLTLIENPNFLILDEPTNDLDIMTLAMLEDFLLAYT